jgi:hypothetical protein
MGTEEICGEEKRIKTVLRFVSSILQRNGFYYLPVRSIRCRCTRDTESCLSLTSPNESHRLVYFLAGESGWLGNGSGTTGDSGGRLSSAPTLVPACISRSSASVLMRRASATRETLPSYRNVPFVFRIKRTRSRHSPQFLKCAIISARCSSVRGSP